MTKIPSVGPAIKGYEGPEVPQWPGGYFIEEADLRRFEGRLLTIVETAGLADKQEEAVKSLVRNEIWDSVGRFYVTSDQSTRIHKENVAMGQSHP